MSGHLDRFFYTANQPLAEGLLVNLSGREAEHMVRVKRHLEGDQILLLDGQGKVAVCKITSIQKRKPVELEILSVEEIEKPVFDLHIAVAIPKGDRMETMLDMLTQLGVARITPLIFSRSQPESRRGREERWQKILVDACKQSRRTHLPALNPLISIGEFLTICQGLNCDKWLADAKGAPVRTVPDQSSQIVIVGPEGGITDEEKTLILHSAFKKLKLANPILRIETAAVAASSSLMTSAMATREK